MRTTRLALVTTALIAAGVLAGCGVAETGVRPGVAAQVGETEISVTDVDTLSSDFCAAVEPNLQQGGTVATMGAVRGVALTTLVSRAIADGIAEDYDVQPGSLYRDAVKQLSVQAARLDDAQAEAFMTVNSYPSYLQDILSAAATKRLQSLGEAEPSQEAIDAAAQQLYSTWPAENGLELDPRFGRAFVDGRFVASDTGLSVPVSEVGKRDVDGEETPPWADSLPDSLRCG